MDRISVGIEITYQQIQDLLCNAVEGGSNYWCVIEKYNYPKGQTKESLKITYPHLELPFKGGSLSIRDTEDDKVYVLGLLEVEQGLQVMAKKFQKHFADFISENDDATTGDVFLQCCLFKDVIYG